MFDRIFSGLLTFSLLMAGTLAVGSALFGHDLQLARTPGAIIELPRVTVTGQRTALMIGGSAMVATAQDSTDCAVARTTTPTAAPAAIAPPTPTHI